MKPSTPLCAVSVPVLTVSGTYKNRYQISQTSAHGPDSGPYYYSSVIVFTLEELKKLYVEIGKVIGATPEDAAPEQVEVRSNFESETHPHTLYLRLKLFGEIAVPIRPEVASTLAGLFNRAADDNRRVAWFRERKEAKISNFGRRYGGIDMGHPRPEIAIPPPYNPPAFKVGQRVEFVDRRVSTPNHYGPDDQEFEIDKIISGQHRVVDPFTGERIGWFTPYAIRPSSRFARARAAGSLVYNEHNLEHGRPFLPFPKKDS